MVETLTRVHTVWKVVYLALHSEIEEIGSSDRPHAKVMSHPGEYLLWYSTLIEHSCPYLPLCLSVEIYVVPVENA